MSRTRVTFKCGDLSLEGEFSIPEGQGGRSAVVVCHPHPLMGGDMDSHVVTDVCRRLEKEGIAYLRFNFRGTGRSEGMHAQGIGEQDDLKAAITCLEEMEGVDKDRIGVAGYSFGAGVSSSVAAAEDRVKALATISLGGGIAALNALRTCTKPKLFILGRNDAFIPVAEFQSMVESLPDPKRCLVVDGADHFWHYDSDLVAKEVAEFFSKALYSP